jgi:hypothetical protein
MSIQNVARLPNNAFQKSAQRADNERRVLKNIAVYPYGHYHET